ncbi:response regulator transcription factor [Clostridium sp.]|uniref:response regulator transcription factor n=1 Tax=Clostridium sp. TaxID=1506 RepID=UPI002FCBB5EC
MNLLLIEDDISLNRGISFALKKEGLNVFSATTIAEGEKAFKEKDIKLIVLDVNLPDGNGFDLCMEIRKTSDVPIVFLTAQSSELEITNGLDMGADDYITKPFSVRELVSRINAILRRSNNYSRFNKLVSKDIVFSTESMKVEKLGEEVFLSKKELKLIQYFMSNPQIILTKDQILQSIWDNEGSFVDENVVAVNIKRLRGKIEDNYKEPEYIQNIRGIGYVWAQGCVKR